MSAIAATAVTTAFAVGAYSDARFHISKDLKKLWQQWRANKAYLAAVKENKLSLWYLFEEQVEKSPHSECIWSQTESYTRKEVYEQCCRYANWLLLQGVEPGQWVAIYLQNCAEFMFIWIALWSIGCAPALINHNLRGEALLHVLKNSGSALVLVDAQLADKLSELHETIEKTLGIKVFVVGDFLKMEISQVKSERPDDSFRANVKGDDNQALIFTSGTSGKPKGVPHTVYHGYLYGIHGTKGLEVGSNHRWYQCMPLYHGTGGMVSIICLLSGTTLCIGRKFSASQFWEDIRISRSTCFTIRAMFGNGLRPDVWKRFRDRFGIQTVVEFFGSSEGVFSLRNCCKGDQGDYLIGAVGHHGLLLRQMMREKYVPVLVDTDGDELVRSSVTGYVQRVSYETGGEILVQIPSENVFPGYFLDPIGTSRKFARDVFSQGDLWYRTGDALRRTSDGRWFFLDRLGDTYRWKSENVSTAEVSAILGHYPGVMEAIVYGVSLPQHEGRAGCAALVLDETFATPFDFLNFHEYVCRKLPQYAVPVFLRLGNISTHTHNNKQNKVPLRDQGVDPRRLSSGDRILWTKPGNPGYVAFTQEDWDRVGLLQVKL
ncbi:hypothetical protein LTR84_005756 [Exophiala bonariae]|uniref:AMP-dependent synthetase/ligase domain-containing protein n=1 Tax=Exophiala bonariae TaxID=1690606 RepID=A0AAV9N7C7_9EURO|nr:hypothetical protein LTR84_005756 [Exophiala bonariae]